MCIACDPCGIPRDGERYNRTCILLGGRCTVVFAKQVVRIQLHSRTVANPSRTALSGRAVEAFWNVLEARSYVLSRECYKSVLSKMLDNSLQRSISGRWILGA